MIGSAREDRGARAAAAVLLLLVIGAIAPARAGAPFPDPRRFEGDIAAFEAADRECFPPEGALLCIGSSSMRMWHPTLAADLAPATVIPRGFGGSTMLDALFFAGRIVLPYRPSAILLYEGDNDIALGVPPEKVFAAFDSFVSLVRASLPGTKIHVISVKPSPSRREFLPETIRVNRLLREACDADTLLAFIDVASPMLNEKGEPIEELFLEDMLHMNEKGYAVWREVVRKAIYE
ncbi:MAG: hypothetical protein JW958_07045 [Candidatus Eisenbacteria bacterium]|nr:hypothetical protein [Candidatus Eisenbacteria bacterium]